MDSPTKLYPDIPPEKHISDEERTRNEQLLRGMQLVTKAADFAARKHRTQRRKDAKQTPYINHPVGTYVGVTATTILKHGGLGVAHLLTDIAKVSDPVTLAGAYLHDTVEDTDTTFAELEEEFGMEVSELVRECTDDKSLPKEQRKQLQIDNAPKHSHKVQATSKRLLNYTTTMFRLA